MLFQPMLLLPHAFALLLFSTLLLSTTVLAASSDSASPYTSSSASSFASSSASSDISPQSTPTTKSASYRVYTTLPIKGQRSTTSTKKLATIFPSPTPSSTDISSSSLSNLSETFTTTSIATSEALATPTSTDIAIAAATTAARERPSVDGDVLDAHNGRSGNDSSGGSSKWAGQFTNGNASSSTSSIYVSSAMLVLLGVSVLVLGGALVC